MMRNGWEVSSKMPAEMLEKYKGYLRKQVVGYLLVMLILDAFLSSSVVKAMAEGNAVGILLIVLVFNAFMLWRIGRLYLNIDSEFEWCYTVPDKVTRKGGYWLDEDYYVLIGGKGGVLLRDKAHVFVRVSDGLFGRVVFGYDWKDD